MKTISALAFSLTALLSISALAQSNLGGLGIGIRVINPYTKQNIDQGSTLSAITPFQVIVTTNGINCAGQFVITALGAPGNPPSVVVQNAPFIIGPAVNKNSVSSKTFTSDVRPDGFNDWKITASCNGAKPSASSFAFFEFFVQIP